MKQNSFLKATSYGTKATFQSTASLPEAQRQTRELAPASGDVLSLTGVWRSKDVSPSQLPKAVSWFALPLCFPAFPSQGCAAPALPHHHHQRRNTPGTERGCPSDVFLLGGISSRLLAREPRQNSIQEQVPTTGAELGKTGTGLKMELSQAWFPQCARQGWIWKMQEWSSSPTEPPFSCRSAKTLTRGEAAGENSKVLSITDTRTEEGCWQIRWPASRTVVETARHNLLHTEGQETRAGTWKIVS